MVPLVDVLVPTYNRPAALAVSLACMIGQEFRDFDIIIVDQGDEDVSQVGEVQAVTNVLRAHGHQVSFYKNLPRRGMAQQRQYLLDQAAAPYVLFLDDDVILETYVFGSLVRTIRKESCGFVGSALNGLTFIDEPRPDEQAIEFWEGKVTPEAVRPGTPAWERYKLHNAANLYHVAQKLSLDPRRPRRYKVAWVGGCVLYDAEKLRAVGGFSFWTELPADHAGEDVLAELRVMDVYGGCGIIPSGVYHQQIPTTIPDREVDAPKYLEIDHGAQQNEMENT
jgi:glycosyltransferase involved in cell wall biosynthesis